MIHFETFDFHPVIRLPQTYEVYDFTSGYDPKRLTDPYGVGRYNEKRKQMYNSDLFTGGMGEARDIHVGIDIAAPVGTDIYAFFEGRILLKGVNRALGDYGPTLITEHKLGSEILYALWGHLATAFYEKMKIGQSFAKGEVIAQVGSQNENGGWNPHLHFQLSTERPTQADLPGVVSEKDLSVALLKYPDPRLVLGPLY